MILKLIPEKYFFYGLLIFGCTSFGIGVQAQTLAFPGAEGFGKYTSGGRRGNVIIVQNLNDDGPGSLRAAIQEKGPRIITFAISGTIALQSTLDIKEGNLTIAGQSAPGDGICIKGYPLKINADNVIIRYMRFRLGDENKVEDDAASGMRNKDIIIDHCSFSWSTDEAASFYDNENFTMQWCIISESLNNSVHSKGEHGYGGIWGGMGASFHHNLFAHHKSRNPRFNGARTNGTPDREIVDFRNNVIYNWKINSAYAGEEGNYNMVNNYYKPGPATRKSLRSRIVNPWQPYGNFYIQGNFVEGDEAVTKDNVLGVACDDPEAVIVAEPIPVMTIPEQTALQAYELVLAEAGASYKRDAVDKRIVSEVGKGTVTYGHNGIIDSQKAVGGWPILNTAPAPKDSDQDGMPDTWEKENGLDPQDPKDEAEFNLSEAYTNVELYLNQLLHKNGK